MGIVRYRTIERIFMKMAVLFGLEANFLDQFICQVVWGNYHEFDYFIRSLVAIVTRVNRLIIFDSAFSAVHIY